ncbi:DM DNA binding domain protein [Ancylostoma duodenale]|uniref:DM DNA binding domain protein n=1 Tax=Ancylostoma duodenale TaxID=51022 RepID=A0A0C2GBJ6_9BILA|nr:DM DNA binding domain protein [Ancylostoma duodenale]
MSTQIRLRREQDKRFQRTTNASEADVIPLNTVFEADKRDDINMCYFCQKCKNHGILMWKKDHKRNCEYANCRCEQCDLIDTRRALDRHIKRNKDLKTGASCHPTTRAQVPPRNPVPAVTLSVVHHHSKHYQYHYQAAWKR